MPTGGVETNLLLTIIGGLISILGLANIAIIGWLYREFSDRDDERKDEMQEQQEELQGSIEDVAEMVDEVADTNQRLREAIFGYSTNGDHPGHIEETEDEFDSIHKVLEEIRSDIEEVREENRENYYDLRSNLREFYLVVESSDEIDVSDYQPPKRTEG